jgi:hypothetical protein
LSVHKTWYAVFFVAGLALVVLAGRLQPAPGYMDAEYYYGGSIALADGKGPQQPFIWNYLDQPAGLPTPAFTYWMPLVSLLGSAGYALFHTFNGARGLLWLLAALIPPLTVFLGMRLHGKPELAITGGFFALFPVYYAAFLPTTDSFAVYMLLGSSFLLASSHEFKKKEVRPLLVGALAGLMHMTRADGLLWLVGGTAWLAWNAWREPVKLKDKCVQTMLEGLLCLAGYGVVASPWYARNLAVFQRLFPPGGNRSLWFTRYEDLFVYPADLLTPGRWLSAGYGQIIFGWWQAFLANLQTSIAVQASIALVPFIVIGMILYRRLPIVKLAAGLWIATWVVFTLVFPFAGINGSFFHSGAAFQPVFWAAAPVGISEVVGRIARWRKWERRKQVQRFLEILLICVCMLLSVGLFRQRMLGNETTGTWGSSATTYSRIEQSLKDLGATPCEVVMVNNPPGFYLASGRSAVVIPFGDEQMLKEAASRYGVRYLVLEVNNSGHLSRLYLSPASYPGFRYLTSVGQARIYEFIQ